MSADQPGPTPAQQSLALLKSIDASLKTLVKISLSKRPMPKAVASDRELDGAYGDPEVRLDPRDWTGTPRSFKGKRLSQCPADYLDMSADMHDSFAEMNEASGATIPTGKSAGKPKAPYNRKDAALCRGWAARVRAGKVPQRGAAAAQSEPAENPFDSDADDPQNLGDEDWNL